MFKTIAPYAAVLALFYVYLSVRTIGFRRKAKVSVGDGGDDGLLRAIRVHANFAEYVPIALILIALIESQDGPASLVHGLGALLIAAGASIDVCHSSPKTLLAVTNELKNILESIACSRKDFHSESTTAKRLWPPRLLRFWIFAKIRLGYTRN
jgi:uncharacterized membrane protein YecN with MAPEG domain